jgi:hypothetical protein
MKILAIIAALSLTGCAGFTGKREISFKLSIMNNSIEWTSTCDGGYSEKDPKP